MFYLTRAQGRQLDQLAGAEFGLPDHVLMENAGRGAAELLQRLGLHGPVAVGCGKGNNGGDGFVLARHLDIRHVPVRVHLFGRPEELTGAAAMHFQSLAKSGVPLSIHAGSLVNAEDLQRALGGAEWIVDALFGTGLTGPVRSPFDQVIAALNACPSKIFALDVPSGLDADTGQSHGPTVKAARTATFAALKQGFLQPSASAWLGQVHVVDIGAPRGLIERFFAKSA